MSRYLKGREKGDQTNIERAVQTEGHQRYKSWSQPGPWEAGSTVVVGVGGVRGRIVTGRKGDATQGLSDLIYCVKKFGSYFPR